MNRSCMKTHSLLRANVVGEQSKVSIRGDEGEDPLGLPALEPNTRVEADIIQQPRILGDRGRGPGWFGGE